MPESIVLQGVPVNPASANIPATPSWKDGMVDEWKDGAAATSAARDGYVPAHLQSPHDRDAGGMQGMQISNIQQGMANNEVLRRYFAFGY